MFMLTFTDNIVMTDVSYTPVCISCMQTGKRRLVTGKQPTMLPQVEIKYQVTSFTAPRKKLEGLEAKYYHSICLIPSHFVPLLRGK